MGSEEIEKQKGTGVAKQVLRLAFSHMGLCVIVVVYCVIGGFLFELLEKQNEIVACQDARKEYNDMENDTLFSLLDVVLTTQLNSYEADVQLKGVFESFRNNSFSIGYEGEWCEGYGKEDGPVHEWTFAGGLFFSMTVITTIGYGHISPATVWGRIFCISYAMMGIPLMLMFLANIGDILADIFRYIYAKIICCGCLKKKKRKGGMTRPQTAITEEPGGSPMLGHTNPAFLASKDDNIIASRAPVNHAFNNSNDDNSASSREPSITGSNDGLMPGSRPGSSSSNDVTKRNSVPRIKALNTSDIAERARLRHLVAKNSQKEPLVLEDESDDEEDEEEWDEISKVAVPLTVSMGIIGLYIIGGAILFKYWEGWDMLQSSYFCFITLSTIGFGDVTPGRDFTDPTANARLVIGTIYSIFGMAILSMCFTLMQEEMISKFRWIGMKMGVISEDDEEEDFSNIELDKPNAAGGQPQQMAFNRPQYKDTSDC